MAKSPTTLSTWLDDLTKSAGTLFEKWIDYEKFDAERDYLRQSYQSQNDQLGDTGYSPWSNPSAGMSSSSSMLPLILALGAGAALIYFATK